MAGKPRLGARDWTDAGLKALEEHGYPAIRADRLAATLGVSRGSFYWHFPDVDAFEAALIARWREIVLEALDPPMAPGETARDRFATIMRRSLLTGRRLELQFRAWGAVNPSVRAALDRVDANRQAYFVRLLSDPVRDQRQTLAACRIAYWTYLGRMQTTPVGEADVDAIVGLLLTLLDQSPPVP